MSMHLEGPWLSTSGKKKGKQKFRNSEQARKARQLKEEWEDLLKRHGIEQEQRRKTRAMTAETLKPSKPSYRGSDEPKIPSLPFTGGPCTKPAEKIYTGTNIVGIATMHKSNAVPVFNADAAKDISKMRR